ncbi:MAG: hypothetical protein GY822_31195 [Deltaproteobacteria bacterium]|nr:hypothetical protein [Deltaproteobacteria bacterium]
MAQPIDNETRAARLARTIASDITLYNEEKIVKSIVGDTLFEDLEEEFEEGRELYRGRVTPDLYARTNFYERAIVDVVLRPKGHIESSIW